MRTDELWCNGSTTDSDSVCLGSNPGSSTKVPLLRGAFFCAVGGAEMPPDVRKCRGGAEMSRGRGNVAGAREILKKCVFLRKK